MLSELDRLRILNALVDYDKKQSGKRSYNPYALAHYCKAVDNAAKHCSHGADLRLAILNCFQGRLCDIVLKSVGLTAMNTIESKYSEFEKLPDCYLCNDTNSVDGGYCPNCDN